MRKFWITFCFYAKEHFSKKALIWIGIYFAATIGIFFAINHFGGNNEHLYGEIAIVQASTTFIADEQQFEGITDRHIQFLDEAAARALLEAGELDEIFIISGEERPELTVVSAHFMPGSEVEVLLTQLLTSQHVESIAAGYALPVSAVAELTTPITVHVEELEDLDVENAIASDLINTVLPFGIYMLVLMSGSMVANSVASEKTSRVMEVMLGKVHPTMTMLSKVLSTLLGVLVPIVTILLGMVAADLLGFVELGTLATTVGEFIPIEVIILTLAVLFLGYFCFIFFFAAAGAVANSSESLTSTLQPVMYATMIPFFLIMFIDLDSWMMNILVYVPFMSPYVIVQRFLMGYSNMIEVIIVLCLMAAFSVLALIISARLYLNGISHTSEKVSLKDLKKMLAK
ncbi:MAG: ABC transporter permease [Defluviitaleaceae bacterium]|nr:ABC transporter permease [Defluviitaleaceae bacterium]